MKKIIVLVLLIFLIPINNIEAVELTKGSKSSVLIEATTQEVIFDNKSNLTLPPASMTKIMTLTIIFEYLDKGKIKLDDTVIASKEACGMGGSQVYLKENEEMCVKDMIKAVCIASANDCAYALAEHVLGSKDNFVSKMNEIVKDLDLKNTVFKNPTGLSEEGHYTSSYDMAIMAANLINNYPEVLEYTKLYQDYIRQDTESPFWLVNTNKLIRRDSDIDGLKTGWTEEAGYCITLTKKKDNMRLISVVMGYSNVNDRNDESLALLNYGFSNYEMKTILSKNTVICEHKNIMFKPSDFLAITKDDFNILVNKGDDDLDISWDINKNPDYINDCDGVIDIYYGEKKVGETKFNSDKKIKKRNFIEIVIEVIKCVSI